MKYKLFTLYGGKGNQIFQTLHYLKTKKCRKNKYYLIFDVNEVDNDVLKIINDFNIKHIKLSNIFIKLLYQFSKYKIFRFLFSISSDNDFVDDCVFHIGYWQGFDVKNINIINSIYDDVLNENELSIHIRKGDYLNKRNKSIYAQMDFNYYIENIRELSKYNQIDKINMISNGELDIEILNEIAICFPNVFVYNCNQLNADECFKILLLSKFNIIPNSTFSLVASFYKFEEKVTKYPNKWFNKNIFNYDIIKK